LIASAAFTIIDSIVVTITIALIVTTNVASIASECLLVNFAVVAHQ
jgi:hypothetical protein